MVELECEAEIDRRIRAYNKSMTPAWNLREVRVKKQTVSEIFAELDKEDCGDKSYEEPALLIGYHAYRNIKNKFEGSR